MTGAAIDLGPVVLALQAAATAGDGEACFYLAHMHSLGRGVDQDMSKVSELMSRAAGLGFEPAIDAVKRDKLQQFRTPRRKFLAHPDWSSDVVIEG